MCCNLSRFVQTLQIQQYVIYLKTLKTMTFTVAYILNENRLFHQMGLLCLMNQEVSCARFHQKSLTKVVKKLIRQLTLMLMFLMNFILTNFRLAIRGIDFRWRFTF